MSVALENIGGESCEPVSGLATQAWWAEQGDFTTLIDPKDVCSDSGNGADNFTELVKITGNHVMAAGKKLHAVDFIIETGDIKTTMIGAVGRTLFNNEQKIEIAGSAPEILGFLRYIRNKKLIWFVEEFGSGQIRQFGSKRLAAHVKAIDSAIEAAIEGKNSVTLTIEDKQKWPAPIYAGTMSIATDSE